MNALVIYGITYGNHTTEHIPYQNTNKDNAHRFEYNPMIYIVDNKLQNLSDEDYLSILSWKFKYKTRVDRHKLRMLFERAQSQNKNTECYNLSPDLKLHPSLGTFMKWSNDGHAGIRVMVQKCCHHVGIIYEENPPNIIYANQFAMKKRTYIDYINAVIKPCLELLEGEMWEEVNKPSGYSAGVKLAELKNNTGLDFYNYVPFILERMTMQYVNAKGIQTVNLV